MDSLAQAGDCGGGSFVVVVVVSLFDGLAGWWAGSWVGDGMRDPLKKQLLHSETSVVNPFLTVGVR